MLPSIAFSFEAGIGGKSGVNNIKVAEMKEERWYFIEKKLFEQNRIQSDYI